MYFSDSKHVYMEHQMRQTATELLSHVAIGACDNTITLQESRPQDFVALYFCSTNCLHSQANLVAIQRKLCKFMHNA